MGQLFDLPEPLPFKFRPCDKALYYAIRRDVEANRAFEHFTSGREAIDPSWLLLSLGTEYESGARPEHWHKRERWKEKWVGLQNRGFIEFLNTDDLPDGTDLVKIMQITDVGKAFVQLREGFFRQPL